MYPRTKEEVVAMGLAGNRNEEMRGMTIAAFRISQNESDIDDRFMNGKLLSFLVSDSAIKHWKSEGRLADGENGIYLTVEGLSECTKSLKGETRGYNVSEKKVDEWVQRMLSGDRVTTETYEIHQSSAVQGRFPKREIDQYVLACILSRRGQSTFRTELLHAYDVKCAITKCSTEAALEAAHIIPHSLEQSYSINNGILLRADIHTLFDLFFISINPETGKVVIAPECNPSYKQYEGCSVSFPSKLCDSPDPSSLMIHYKECIRRHDHSK
ncbi:HNH endonuclease [Shewanella ulleungensis]|nr:HNH endonuclease [Shewanella ulleungensis]MCL1148868.1 HNH endonuclease [Shewanella ulleungensis]